MTLITSRNPVNTQASAGPLSLKNGLYSKSAILPGENRQEYLAFGVSFVVDLRPEGPVQSELVQLISDNMWRLRRLRALEANQTHRVSETIFGSANSTLQMQEVNILECLGHHEQRIQNGMFKAFKQLKELQSDTRVPRESALKQTTSGFVPSKITIVPNPSSAMQRAA